MGKKELITILNERIRMFDEQRKVHDKIKELKKKAMMFKQEQEQKEHELLKEVIVAQNRIKNGQ